MAKKPTKIQRLMDEKPEMFDFGDIPADRVIHPEQEKWYDDRAPDFFKEFKSDKGA